MGLIAWFIYYSLNPLFHPCDIYCDCLMGVPREAKMCLMLIAETNPRFVGDIAILLVCI